MTGWHFFIDRGGTFTDIVARDPKGRLHISKLLSKNTAAYDDAALEGIRRCLQAGSSFAKNDLTNIVQIRMGTTVGTNALLERTGAAVLYITNQGLADLPQIAYQNRPDIFALEIKKSKVLYTDVLEVAGRLDAEGSEIHKLDEVALRQGLLDAHARGLRSCAIVFMHAYQNPVHEIQAAKLAEELGFEQVSTSHEVSPLIKIVRRANTTLLDAYLSPVLQAHTQLLREELKQTRLYFMRSQGGLVQADNFRGRDCLLSGPAGGVVGGVAIAKQAGIEQLIGFDMGGTSTDVWHYRGEMERQEEAEIGGVHLQSPMLHIHTVAAGGGSLIQLHGGRLKVGPRSAGADPGPVCYGRGGALSLTDANLMLGRLQTDFFPSIFGPAENQALDLAASKRAFAGLAQTIATHPDLMELAEGCFRIAVHQMAAAIRQITLERGYDASQYTLCAFGGAAGQHACAVAEELRIHSILLHPYAGVLSALGMGLADFRVLKEIYAGCILDQNLLELMQARSQPIETHARQELATEGCDLLFVHKRYYIKYAESDTVLAVESGSLGQMQADFHNKHREHFGFIRPDAKLSLERIELEFVGQRPESLALLAKNNGLRLVQSIAGNAGTLLKPVKQIQLQHSARKWNTPVYQQAQLEVGNSIQGPALLISKTDTLVVDPGWLVQREPEGALLLRHTNPAKQPACIRVQKNTGRSRVDPVQLELFFRSFESIATEMGVVLRKSSASVNIKERLDFSCAIFDAKGSMVANAPHIPVHLGSMSVSVQSIINKYKHQMQAGDAYICNDPYTGGGTHLPDITVVLPVFIEQALQFCVAARGHHADIGGLVPGSMPAASSSIQEEGVLIEPRFLVRNGKFLEESLQELFLAGPYPARNWNRNRSDLEAQLAAGKRGVRLLQDLCQNHGIAPVQFYMDAIRNNAAAAVQKLIPKIKSVCESVTLDNGLKIQLRLQPQVDLRDPAKNKLRIDFAGSSAQHTGNCNAPVAVVRAAILYCLRLMLAQEIPLNDGCLEPIEIYLPGDCFLNPHFPAAVVAGNVETSQVLVSAILRACGVQAASQGTMNNLIFGDANHQYYETLCGGAGAGRGYAGASAVQVHMTNSRLTDPEVLEARFGVRLLNFSIRRGSGGKGEFAGGDGIQRELLFLHRMQLSILSNDRSQGPRGLAGGQAGAVGHNRLQRVNEKAIELDSFVSLTVEAGDRICIETPGGGGFGCPPPNKNQS